jgi:peptidoglycan/LPS O-acetylase OafA/YrhL
MKPAEKRTLRLPGLDLVRAVAIAWVMIYHAMNFGLVPAGDNWFVQFGWMGVDLFFVLSGYLIGGQLLRPLAAGRQPDYGLFFAKRLLRTLPAFLVVIALYALVPEARERPAMQPLWQFVTFTENLLLPYQGIGKTFSHVWSLCVEEQFYLVFPLAVLLLGNRPSPRKTVLALLAVVLLGIGLRGFLWLSQVASPAFDPAAAPQVTPYMNLIYFPTWSRLDGLLAGVALALVRAFRPDLWARLTARPTLLLLAGLALMAAAILLFDDQITGLFGTMLGFPLLATGVALIVAAGAEPKGLIGTRALPGAGALAVGAYSLYLSHKIAYHVAQTWLIPALGLSGWAGLALAIGLALLFGAVLYWAVERPFLHLRDRWLARFKPRPAPSYGMAAE